MTTQPGENEMIERVAEVIEAKLLDLFCGTMGLGDATARDFACAAIAAMREPTEAMLEAEICKDNFFNLQDGSPIQGGIVLNRGECLWKAMIDAALGVRG